MFRTIERADVVAGILVVGAAAYAIHEGKLVTLLIAAAMVSCHYAITRRHILGAYRAGRRSRNAETVVDLESRRKLAVVPDHPRRGRHF